MRHAVTLLAAALVAAHAGAGTVSKDLERVLAAEGHAKIVVYFHDQEIATRRAETQEEVILRLQRNLAKSQELARSELGFADEAKIRSWSWIANTMALEADRDTVEAIAAHPAVKRVLWDEPVMAPPRIESKSHRQQGAYTYGLEIMGIPQVREVYGITGKGVLVGNIDTGADGNHPDLAGKIALYKDFGEGTTVPTDEDGHGTHTAATMVGGASSGTSIGVAPDAKIVIGRGIAGSNTISALLQAMQWMLDPDGNPATKDGPRVVSMSWHTGSADQEPFYETLYAYEAAGVCPNFSAGNSGSSGLTHPKEHPATLTNAATDNADNIADFSSRGPAKYKGQTLQKPEWAAPGVDVFSAKPGGGYQEMSGTSMAAPHGAGVIALLLEADPTLTPAQIKEVLQSTAKDLGPPGWDGAFGMGRLDAFKAVSLVAKGGKINGKVTGAGGAPLGIARIKVVERDFEIGPKEDGSFSLRLPEGSYTLQVSCFAYHAKTIPISVTVGGELTVDVALDAAETVEVAGVVKARQTGEGVAAKLRILGTPLAEIATAADGTFAVSLPAGTYSVRVAAFGFKVATAEVTAPGSLTFELDALPPILVVDDDKGKGYETFFTGALNALGKDHGVLNRTAGELDDTTLTPYKTVIWFTGDDYQETLSTSDQAKLQAYLAAGGKLILSGQDIGYELKGADFYKNVLKAEFVKDSAEGKQVTGQGLSFKIEGGDGAGNQKYADVVKARAGASEIFSYGNGQSAGLRVGTSIVYLSFGLEGVDTAANRAALLGKALSLLEGSEATDVVTPASRGATRIGQFRSLHQD